MKFSILIYILSLTILLGCQQKENTACEEFKVALINSDEVYVGTYINNLCTDLQAKITVDDPDGHQENTDILIQRIMNDCDVSVSLVHYALIETFPTQSEISVSVIENQDTTIRVIDLLNDPDGLLSFAGMHE